MRFIIKPADNSLQTLLETEQYATEWKRHARAIRKAFQDVSGLEFQQRVITAHVYQGEQSEAGSFHTPMRLAADYRTPEDKLVTIVHELSHRLLGGNALGTHSLGLSGPHEDNDEISEVEHRHTYLIEYDVMRRALGDKGTEMCVYHETIWRHDANSPHERAWRWVTGLTFEQRQQVLQWLTQRKVTREDWDKLDDDHITRTDIPTWEKQMSEALI